MISKPKLFLTENLLSSPKKARNKQRIYIIKTHPSTNNYGIIFKIYFLSKNN